VNVEKVPPASDDLKAMSEEDVVYLTHQLYSPTVPQTVPVAQVYRGRLRQAGDGSWIVNTFDGNNGVVGAVLGQTDNQWMSAQTPSAGATIRIDRVIYTYCDPTNPGMPPELRETLVLSEVIPTPFAQ